MQDSEKVRTELAGASLQLCRIGNARQGPKGDRTGRIEYRGNFAAIQPRSNSAAFAGSAAFPGQHSPSELCSPPRRLCEVQARKTRPKAGTVIEHLLQTGLLILPSPVRALSQER